ncbi:LuxR family transcriptional regulator [Synechococcus sp. RSCCF101]|uniref:helix-turn-helix domain-containing protein n=1 Tax=Synechococcus sp. RSCCF101 TaxID=2511069 RepID=UPI001247BDEB|nr:helix-turn-helix transcriptional regulator [Synechococcus sp. RSCCF101]QEY32109.1 LuxR family transcriptional regulator [Synechococcus sp. RSCCF101]
MTTAAGPALPDPGADALTPAEARVVRLLQRGLSNRAMAERLVLSPRTIESHLSSALGKSGCRNRLELLLWSLTPAIAPALGDRARDNVS